MQVNDMVRISINDENLYIGEIGKIVSSSSDGSFLVHIIGKQIGGQKVMIWFFANELIQVQENANQFQPSTY